MIPILSLIIGLIVGATSNFILEWFKRKSDARSVAAVISGEIKANLLIINIRGYENIYKQILDILNTGQDVPLDDDIVGDLDQYEPALKANIEKIGLLGPILCTMIGRYWTQMKALRQDFKMLGETPDYPIENKIKMLNEDLTLWKITKNLAEQLVAELDVYSDKSILVLCRDDLRKTFTRQNG